MKNDAKRTLRGLTRSQRNRRKVSMKLYSRPNKRFFYTPLDMRNLCLDRIITQAEHNREGIRHVEVTGGMCSCGAEGCTFVSSIHEKADVCLLKTQKKNAVYRKKRQNKEKICPHFKGHYE